MIGLIQHGIKNGLMLMFQIREMAIMMAKGSILGTPNGKMLTNEDMKIVMVEGGKKNRIMEEAMDEDKKKAMEKVKEDTIKNGKKFNINRNKNNNGKMLEKRVSNILSRKTIEMVGKKST